MTILVYQDYVHNNGTLFRRLCASFGAENVTFCDASDIIGGTLAGARLLVMPGGADLYYAEKLNGAGNAAIRAFVENGGAYLGICAGAYYACRAIEWAKNETAAICGARELGFYDGIATGPVYEFIEDGDFTKSWDNAAALAGGDRDYTALYSGGPVFSGGAANEIAHYRALPGRPPAIIECTVGAGKAVLCSPHIEHDRDSYRAAAYRHGNASPDWTESVARRLPAATERAALWNYVLARVLPEGKLRDAA